MTCGMGSAVMTYPFMMVLLLPDHKDRMSCNLASRLEISSSVMTFGLVMTGVFLLPLGGFCWADLPRFGDCSNVGAFLSSKFSIPFYLASAFIDLINIVVYAVTIEIEVFTACHDLVVMTVFHTFKPCHDLGCHVMTYVFSHDTGSQGGILRPPFWDWGGCT